MPPWGKLAKLPLRTRRENPDIERAFELMDKGLLMVFSFELTLQFICHGMQLFTDVRWLLFDFAIVMASR
jgi:hypothetical protein